MSKILYSSLEVRIGLDAVGIGIPNDDREDRQKIPYRFIVC
jgi:hypothetical protein